MRDQQHTFSGNPEWKDTPRSTAEQIEISLRSSNASMQHALENIRTQCNFVKANSDNATSKMFCDVVLRIVNDVLKD